MESVLVKLPAPTLAALHQIAKQDDISVGQILRDAVNRDLLRREKAKTPVRADERIVAPLRALLADDFAYSTDWAELRSRLASKGYMLREVCLGGQQSLQRFRTWLWLRPFDAEIPAPISGA